MKSKLVKRDQMMFLYNGTHHESKSKTEILDDIRPLIVGRFEQHTNGLRQRGINAKAPSLTDAKMNNTFSALRAGIPKVDMDAPCWLDDKERPDPTAIVPLRNGLLDVDTRSLMPHTPLFFNLWSLPYDYDPMARVPPDWLNFLDVTFDRDAQRKDLLQELSGYMLTADTSYEKFPWLLGPPASGKGTAVTVIQQLVGLVNICALDVYNLDRTFSLDGVLGKSLILFNEGQDSRKRDFSGPIVSRINQITGRDLVRVEQKNKGSVSLVLPTKIMGVSNDMPVFRDASNAINRRLIVLPFDNPVPEHKRDRTLKARLAATENLPGLFNWALEGLARLRKQRRFTVPTASKALQDEIAVAGSPVKAFANECLTVDSEAWESTTHLYAAYSRFARQRDLYVMDKGIFAKNLRSSVNIHQKRRGPKGNQVPGYSGISIKSDYQVLDESELLLAEASG